METHLSILRGELALILTGKPKVQNSQNIFYLEGVDGSKRVRVMAISRAVGYFMTNCYNYLLA